MEELRQGVEEYVSEHQGYPLRAVLSWLMTEHGVDLETARRARKTSAVTVQRKGKHFVCHVDDEAAAARAMSLQGTTTNLDAVVRIGRELLPKGEWQEVMKQLRAGKVYLLVVPTGVEVQG